MLTRFVDRIPAFVSRAFPPPEVSRSPLIAISQTSSCRHGRYSRLFHVTCHVLHAHFTPAPDRMRSRKATLLTRESLTNVSLDGSIGGGWLESSDPW